MENTKPITDEQFEDILANYREAVIKAEELCNIVDRIDSMAEQLNNRGYRCTDEQLEIIMQQVEKLTFIMAEVH